MKSLGKVPLLLLLLAVFGRISYAAVVPSTTEDAPYTTDDIPTTTDNDDDGSGDDNDDNSNEGTEENQAEDKDWINNTLIYHIWPRSFQDSDGDGEGDLQGIINRLDYLVDIGIDTIRLSSVYVSPLIDAGSDVSNHTNVHPLFGDVEDLEELIRQAHNKGLKVILDIIPNHSSDQHEWFIASAADEEPYDDYYIWADGKIKDNKLLPPNNWKSVYDDDDGSAWTWHTGKRKWYYHKFHHTEPDLNLRNEDVIQEILRIFDFWLERDVDGFCITSMSYLFENEELTDESSEEEGSDENDDDDESHTESQPGNADIIFRFREHIDQWVEDHNETPKLLIGEIDEDDDDIKSYYGNETHSGIIPLNLILITKLNDTSDAGDVEKMIEEYMEQLPEGAEATWVLSNQDYPRAASRLDKDILDGLYMLTMLLPGQAVIYYGEEIGMTNGNVSLDNAIDIKAVDESKEDYEEETRDPFRTPMQWDNSVSAGFSIKKSTFLPVNPNYVEINVKRQLRHLDSNLIAFKTLAALRKNPIFMHGDHELTSVNDDNVLLLKRSFDNDTCIVAINFGTEKQTVNLTELYPDLEEDLQVMVDSSNADVEEENDEDNDDDVENDAFVLHAKASAVLCDKDDFGSSVETTTSVTDGDSDETTEDDSTEDPQEVLPVPTTEPPEPSSANKIQTLQFIVIFHLALLLLFRTL